jgi:AcrR family transcriptional regulator
MRKSDRTRRRILDAAAQLILERGGQGFQMGELATLCEMSKGSLYYYFADRAQIVEELLGEASDQFADRLEAVAAGCDSSEEALRASIELFCQAISENGLVVAAMTSMLHCGSNDDMLPRIRDRYERITGLVQVQIERAKGEGVVRADVDSRLAAHSICGMVVFGAVSRLRLDGADFDSAATAQELFDVMMDGMRAR